MKISVRGLSKAYGGRKVLNDICFDVPSGEIVALMGPNGAGKTSILRVLNMIEKPDEGEVLLDGMVSGGIEHRRRMAMIFQKPVVFNASVYDNVAFGLRVRGADERTIRKRVKEAISMMGIQDMWRNALSLSGGEAQRVALARVMVLRPEVMLLDEPTANLDPSSVRIFEDAVMRMNRDFGTTVVVATHDVFCAKRLADRIIFICDGKIVEDGKADRVFSKPKDERTRRFLRGDIV